MKAKIYIGIIAAMALAVIPAKAQFAENRNFRNDEATLVVNNYYDDYDYYFSSRINRFHRSYSAFSYYSPVFTETYWYNFQPWSWGVSIYGRNLFGFGIAYSYPMYNYGWGNTAWFDPYYGYNYYNGYDPFYSNWYSPVVININVRNRYAYNNYGWYGHSRWHNSYRPVYNTYNYYYNTPSTRYSSRDYSPRPSSNVNNRTTGSDMRRESVSTVNPRTGGVSNRPVAADNGMQNSGTRRDPAQEINRGQANQGSSGNSGSINNNRNNGNSGNTGTNNGNNRNSVENGNNGNFGNNNRNSGNSGNNNNSLPGGNNGNFGNRDNGNKGSAVTVPVERRVQQTTPAINRNNNPAVNSGNTRSSTVNTPSRSQVKSVSAPSSTSQRRATVSPGNSQSSGRSAVTPSRSTSSSKSGSTVSNTRSGSSSKSSGSSGKSSSGSSGESARRR